MSFNNPIDTSDRILIVKKLNERTKTEILALILYPVLVGIAFLFAWVFTELIDWGKYNLTGIINFLAVIGLFAIFYFIYKLFKKD